MQDYEAKRWFLAEAMGYRVSGAAATGAHFPDPLNNPADAWLLLDWLTHRGSLYIAGDTDKSVMMQVRLWGTPAVSAETLAAALIDAACNALGFQREEEKV